MNLELTDVEARVLSHRIMGLGPQSSAEANVLLGIFFRLPALSLPLEPNGAQRSNMPGASPRQAELLPGGVSGRTQGGHEPQRAPQTTEQVRMSTGKYDRESVEQITLTPSKIERKEGTTGPYLSVMWLAQGQRGPSIASCFDEKLFPWVAGRVKQETAFYVVHSGKYTNIVGVRA